MTRFETLFQIGYSIRLEKMQAMFLARVDRFINFSLLLLGAAVVTTVYPVATGFAVAALGAISFVYQPSVKSMQALTQKQKYEKLLACESELADGELLKRYSDLQEGDSLVIGSLACPAHLGELVRRGNAVDFTLTWNEKIAAFIAGDLPRTSTFDQRPTQ
ncbi:hypothetical protein [Paraburkholderia terrae]